MVDGISLEELLEKCTGNMTQRQLAEKFGKCTEKQFPNGIELRSRRPALHLGGAGLYWGDITGI
ncbi:hypothetical protein ACNKHS_25050 [Shigella flexneri]